MSISSGSIVGADGVPTAKLILRVDSGAGSYDATLCLNRELNTMDGIPVTWNYDTLVPKKVGCDINVSELIDSSVEQQYTVMGLDPSTGWVEIPQLSPDGEALLEPNLWLTNPSGGLGCFETGQLKLDFAPGLVYCDVIVCVTGGLVLPPCKTIMGCENFGMYISKQN